ncbi:MAG: hypothetical protein Q9161_007669 [Pseudevernia consocians]
MSVYIYCRKMSQQPLAVKILEPVDAQELKRARRETLISPRVNHEFLLKVLEVHSLAEGTAFVMPLLELGTFNKVDTFLIGMMALELPGFQLKDTLYGSQHAFDTSVGTLIESDMHFAITQEKVMALKTLHVTTAYYPSNRPKAAACFQLWWFERSRKE